MIKSYINMKFEMKSCFMPNISNSESLKVIDVTDCSVVIQMNNPDCKGVFPSDVFQYWIRKGSLVPMNENQQKTS